VARYIGKYGSKAVSKVVIISGAPPYLVKTGDNLEGVDASVFASIEKSLAADRICSTIGSSCGSARSVVLSFRAFLLCVHDLVPIEAYLSASRVSPLTVLTPSKPRLILARIVGIKIDVQVRYSALSKLEDVAETAARSFAPSP